MTVPAPTDSTWSSVLMPPKLPLGSNPNTAPEVSPEENQAPPLPSASVPDEERVRQVLSSPLAMLGMGQRPAPQRRVASFWQKTKYVVTPLLITPLAVGVVGMVGFAGAGIALGALIPSVGANVGVALGVMAGTTVLPPAMSILQVVGIFQAIGRLKTSRVDLAQILDNRRHRKMEKKEARRVKKNGHTEAAAPVSRTPITRYTNLFADYDPPSAAVPEGRTPTVQSPKRRG